LQLRPRTHSCFAHTQPRTHRTHAQITTCGART
jgi:hypothetical protein